MIYIAPRNLSESKIVVTGTATKLLDLIETASGQKSAGQYYLTQKHANIVMLTVETVGIRWFDGASPNAVYGNLLAAGSNFMLPGIHIEELRLVSIGAPAVVSVQFVRSNDEVAVLGQSYSAPAASTAQLSVVDTNNSSATPLGISGVFTGAWTELTAYTNVSVAITTDKLSVTDGLVIQWSQDGVAVDDTDVFTIQNNASKQFTFGIAHKYLRVVYTNDGVAQTVFRLQTMLHASAPKPSSHRLQDNISDQDDVELNKSIIAGRNPSGTYVNFQATAAGNFKTSIEEFETNVLSNSKKQLNVSPFVVDEFGNYSHILGDNVFSGAPLVVDVEHHEIHCGDSYMATRSVDLGNGATDTIIVNVPNEAVRRYHMTIALTSESECNFDIYEGATTVSDGTTLTQYNRDRNSSNTTGITTFHTPNTPAGGTLIETRHWGSGRSAGGETRGAQEIILKNNTKYRFVATNSTTNNNYISWELNHYVHPGI